MRQRFNYEIAAHDGAAGWRAIRTREEVFSRPPQDVARALLESWLLDHPAEVIGGERIAVSTERHPHAHEAVTPTVRVRVYAAGEGPADAEPLATGYLGHDARDFVGAAPETAEGEATVEGWRRVGGQVRRLPGRARGLAWQAVSEHSKQTGLAAAAATSVVAGVLAVRRLRRRGSR